MVFSPLASWTCEWGQKPHPKQCDVKRENETYVLVLHGLDYGHNAYGSYNGYSADVFSLQLCIN